MILSFVVLSAAAVIFRSLVEVSNFDFELRGNNDRLPTVENSASSIIAYLNSIQSETSEQTIHSIVLNAASLN